MKQYSHLLPQESVSKFRNDFGFNFVSTLVNPSLKTFHCSGKTIRTANGYITFSPNKTGGTHSAEDSASYLEHSGEFIGVNKSESLKKSKYTFSCGFF